MAKFLVDTEAGTCVPFVEQPADAPVIADERLAALEKLTRKNTIDHLQAGKLFSMFLQSTGSTWSPFDPDVRAELLTYLTDNGVTTEEIAEFNI